MKSQCGKFTWKACPQNYFKSESLSIFGSEDYFYRHRFAGKFIMDTSLRKIKDFNG